MSNTVRHALRDYLNTLDEPEMEFEGETITQINMRAGERLTAGVDALAQRMKLSRSATAKFILEAAVYDALDEIGLQIGVDLDGERPVYRVMTHDEQLAIIARAQDARSK